jgi:hypothetical protein
MGDELKGIEEDVRFNWDGAATLERELRATAGADERTRVLLVASEGRTGG